MAADDMSPRLDAEGAFARAVKALCEAHAEELSRARGRQLEPPAPCPQPDPGGAAVDVVFGIDAAQHRRLSVGGPGCDMLDEEEDPLASYGRGRVDPLDRWAILMDLIAQAGWLEPEVMQPMKPRSFEVLDLWLSGVDKVFDANLRARSASKGLMDQQIGDELRDPISRLQHWVLKPGSKRYRLWLAAGLAALLFDFSLLPLQLAELVPSTAPLVALNTLIYVYWCFDLPLQFFCGFWTQEGLIEMRPSHIRAKYLRSRFCFDFFVLLIDGAYIFLIKPLLSEGTATDSSIRSIRIVRLLRLVRLLRARQLHGHLKRMLERLQAANLIMFAEIMRFVVTMILINHYVACAWCYLGRVRLEGPEGGGWLAAAGAAEYTVEAVYPLAIHWSLTQFSPSTQNIAPQTCEERWFASVVALLALLVFSSFVSKLTNSVNQLGLAHTSRYVEQEQIRVFLERKGVSITLFGKMQNFFRGPYQMRQGRLQEKDFAFFGHMPDSLLRELHHELYSNLAKSLAFGRRRYKDMLDRLCHEAMTCTSVFENQEVFWRGSLAVGPCCFSKGGAGLYELPHDFFRQVMTVMRSSKVKSRGSTFASAQLGHDVGSRIAAGTWMAEMALVTPWLHPGNLAATQFSDVVWLSAEQFFESVCKSGFPTWWRMRSFALLLVHHVQVAETQGGRVTDMPLPRNSTEELMERAERFCRGNYYVARALESTNPLMFQVGQAAQAI